ncbi:glycoside hydrolase family 43 protein [Deinococcus sp. QL22]|uniref:glycoside hydrolase family 43 protein n=1 Tax=Deinococcus sp. QL22 TaxID=2939437 RepID=UPI0020175063|nr:glycoside hydrolase family 43 protein [Deinococcus sp. QL22]UQN09758.1 glycoside hydrolase family 43 protein [Deinococcus sp. QL22]
MKPLTALLPKVFARNLSAKKVFPREFHTAAEDLPDPNVLLAPDGYYVYATNTPGINVPVVFSADLQGFSLLGDAMPVLPRWVRRGFTWAPDVAEMGGRYVLYFTARLRRSGRQVIGVATSERPEGPFVAADRPLITMLELGGAIDANVLITAGRKRYLYWKNDGNAVGQATQLWGAALSDDGLSLISDPVALLTATEPWERELVEAPQVIEGDGVFHLLYSCADFGDETYAVGDASGPTPLGPFHKTRNAPVLASHGRLAGPGHSHAFRTAAGHWQLAYHAWETGRCGYPKGRRALHFLPLQLDGGHLRLTFPEITAEACD